MPLISLLNNLYSAIDSSNFTPSAGSGQALRQAQDKPFGRLWASPSARLFRTGPSAGSGQALRQAQDRQKTTSPPTGG